MRRNELKALLVCSVTLFIGSCSASHSINLESYGVKAAEGENCTVSLNKAIKRAVEENRDRKQERLTLVLPAGEYHFYPDSSMLREYFISNHDQVNPKNVGIELKGLENITLDAKGAVFIYHSRMLPLSVLNCNNITLRNFSIDFKTPQITQMEFIGYNEADGSALLQIAPWVDYKIDDGVFKAYGEGWENTPGTGIAFEKGTKHIVYNTGDLFYNLKEVCSDTLSGERRMVVPSWKYKDFVPGTVIAARTWHRPAPGIFLHFSTNTVLENIKVHYSEGMGLLAQGCEDVTLRKFGVCLKGADDPRYFTTQADATHFSGCKGTILSENGLYENMMDDAINVHGTYLKVLSVVNGTTVIASYMHPQCYGFQWGEAGDSVQFIRSQTMEYINQKNIISAITPVDAETFHGAKKYRISFQEPLPEEITDSLAVGIENLTWTPRVIFSNNVIRNNRARGALFSTPRKTIVKDNQFYYTSGSAILLCGDCNGWFETGACREIHITGNTFTNALTSMYQFTNGVISICPEIPGLSRQQQYFHGVPGKRALVIENNIFNLYDRQALYAKSVTGLVFRKNKIIYNTEYKPFHRNKKLILLERVTDFSTDIPE